MQRLTHWYPGSVHPVHTGLYQRERNSVIIYCYWDGRLWHAGSTDINTACLLRIPAIHQGTPWRGLCKQSD